VGKHCGLQDKHRRSENGRFTKDEVIKEWLRNTDAGSPGSPGLVRRLLLICTCPSPRIELFASARQKHTTRTCVCAGSSSMLSGTNILAHRARVGFIKLNKAAKYIIVSPGRPYCSTPGAVVAAAAAVAPAAAANLSAIQPPQLELSFAERLGVHASDGRIQLKNLTFEELEEWCQSMGEHQQAVVQLLLSTHLQSPVSLTTDLRLISHCRSPLSA